MPDDDVRVALEDAICGAEVPRSVGVFDGQVFRRPRCRLDPGHAARHYGAIGPNLALVWGP